VVGDPPRKGARTGLGPVPWHFSAIIFLFSGARDLRREYLDSAGTTMPRFALEHLASVVGGSVIGNAQTVVDGIASLRSAQSHHLAPVFSLGLLDCARDSRAKAFLVPACCGELGREQIVCADPRRALGLMLELFAEPDTAPSGAIHPSSVVEESARIDATAWIGPLCYVGGGAQLGPRCRVHPSSYVGEGVRLGQGCVVGPHAVILAGCSLGPRVVVGPGAVVGHNGFGYWRDGQQWRRIPSAGGVELAQDVELGANSCVDAGTLDATRVASGTKIDNLVQVGHNVAVGRRTLLCAQVGLAGSSQVGEDAALGGQVGVGDHVSIGRGARVGGGSGVIRDVADGETVTGYPAVAHKTWLRSSVLLSRLADMQRELRELQRRIRAIEQGQNKETQAGYRASEESPERS